MNDDYFQAAAERVMNIARTRRTEMEAWLLTQPESKACRHHPAVVRPVNVDASIRATAEQGGQKVAVFDPCPECRTERMLAEEVANLVACGIPENLTHATLDNWRPDDEVEANHLAVARDFAGQRIGFLVMLGSRGRGKTHLAVAVARTFRRPMFVEQATLLSMLRATYRDKAATDPKEEAKRAGLLVVDEMGISAGGRDELPMLHEILNHRHGARKPTILTGNITWDELRESIGERMADRLRESAFKILTFSGPTRRAYCRERYFIGE
jgi:DNA replication protein DnaC